MSVSLFTGCVHPHKGFHRGLRLRTKVAYQLSSPASLCRLLYIHTHCGQLRSFFLFCCVSCTVALLRCCAAVSLARLCGRPHISEFCHDFGSTALLFDFDLASCLVVSGHSSARRVFMSVGAFGLYLVSDSSAPKRQHLSWRLHCRFAGTGHPHFLDVRSKVTWHLLDHMHLSLHLSLHLCIFTKF